MISGGSGDSLDRAVGVLLEQDQAVVPDLWELEFANVLRTACRKRRLTADAAHQAIEQICALPIVIDRDTPGPRELLTLALIQPEQLRCRLP